ncbi:MAG: PilW family protein [Burkholderiales bacterium]|nr:PilW family protein [Burkholderiales bacterium]
MSAPRRSRARISRRGMTMVELMVGIAIGMFLVAVASAIYIGSKTTYLAQDATSRLQENGRFAMDTISHDLRMSGFRGCVGQIGATPLANTLNSPNALLYDFTAPIWGSRNAGAAWSPALSAPLDAIGPLAAGDVLVVRRPTGTGWSLIAQMADGTSPLTVSATANITQGDVLLVADCAGGAVLQATNATPGALGSIEHVTGVAGVSPGLAANDLGRALANDALVWRMQTIAYYLAPSVRRAGETSLWTYTWPSYDGSPNQVELVTGVERMAVTYGVDTDGDFAADRFLDASQVADWTQVVSARVDLLLSGNADNTATSPQPYTWAGANVVPADRKLRTTISVAAALRNAVP